MEEVLSRSNGFRRIPLNGLSRLAEQGRKLSFPAGSTLLQQGDEGDTILVLLSGRVRVERSHRDLKEPLLLAQLGPGEIVGEMGVLDGAPRSATVIAIEDTEAVELGAPTVTETILQHPDVSLELLRMLSRRLRSTDELAAAHRGDAGAER